MEFAGDQVLIEKHGDQLTVRPKPRDWADYFATCGTFDADFPADIDDQPIGPTDRGQRSADRLPCPASPAGACHPEPAGVRTVAGSKCGGLVRLQLWRLDGISGIQVLSQKKLSRA